MRRSDVRDDITGNGDIRSRYELKYRISESKAVVIAQFIKPYLHLDRYCKLQPKGSYPVVSLYLDSGNLQLCRQSLEGQKNRFKLRIRSYSDEQNYPHFFEIKRRIDNVIIKTRTRVTKDNVAPLISGLSGPLQDISSDGETLKQFQLYVNSISARPVVRVRYLRQAYEDDSDSRVRVTFDRNLCYNVTSAAEVGLDGQGWRRFSFNSVILEVKFTARYPAWLGRMVGYFDLRRQSVSKYVYSIKQASLLGLLLA